MTDNIDLAVQARHQTASHQNKSLHWTHTFAVKDRVAVDECLERALPQKNVEELEMSEILPSPEVQESVKASLVSLVLRILTKHLPSYKDFAVAVEYHRSHPYSAAMRQKSEQVRGICIIVRVGQGIWYTGFLNQVYIIFHPK